MERNFEALREARRVAMAAPSDERFDMDEVTKHKRCGTAHCWLGWIMDDPWFRAGDATNFYRVVDLLGLDYSEGRVIFGFEEHHTCKSGIEVKAKVIHNADCLLAGQDPISYRSRNWHNIDLSAIHAEIAAADASTPAPHP